MKQEEKELLIKDLRGRLPYGVKVSVGCYRMSDYVEPEGKQYLIPTLWYINPQNLECVFKDCWWNAYIGAIRPYLRPMSSMTKEERKEFTELMFISDPTSYGYLIECILFAASSANAIDWLNAHHFDFRNLIEKKLALEAPEGMYKNSDNTIGNVCNLQQK